ncbi:hypothetical protein BGZ94_008653 [Podila epigama]|nr:hypothetical protein BGZ94_008653 [Podila epigama]
MSPSSPKTGRKPSLGGISTSTATTTKPGAATAVRVSQLNLIDLAGSEKASADMERRKEGAFINKSLLTLGTVISKLTDEKGSHVPYRDSKLTRILQSSLSGNARVSVLCTISPSIENVDESHNTLKFAARIKKVVTRAHTNQVLDDKALLEKYRREISELKAQLMLTMTSTAAGSSTGTGPATTTTALVGLGKGMATGNNSVNSDMKGIHAELSTLLERERLKHEEEMIEMEMVRQALKERIDHLTKLILTSQSINAPREPGERVVSKTYTVERSADGTVLEFPKEIESRLARKDTIVRQLQNELEEQQAKVEFMKQTLQRAVAKRGVGGDGNSDGNGDGKGQRGGRGLDDNIVQDIERTLSRLETDIEPKRREKDRFLIEKRASIVTMNSLYNQYGDSMEPQELEKLAAAAGMIPPKGSRRSVSESGHSRSQTSATTTTTTTTTGLANVSTLSTAVSTSALVADDDSKSLLSNLNLDGGFFSDSDEEDLMDTPWNRAELQSLRQAKRELEIVVIDQEKKLEEMAVAMAACGGSSGTGLSTSMPLLQHSMSSTTSLSVQDSEEFQALILELEEHRERIRVMEEEREQVKVTMAELRNIIRKQALALTENAEQKMQERALASLDKQQDVKEFVPTASPPPPSQVPRGSTHHGGRGMTGSPNASPTQSASSSTLSKRIHELEQMLQKERQLRLEEQNRNMARIASLEADLTIFQAEMSVQGLVD